MRAKIGDYITCEWVKWWYAWNKFMEREDKAGWSRSSWGIPKEWVSVWSNTYWSVKVEKMVKIAESFKVGDYVHVKKASSWAYWADWLVWIIVDKKNQHWTGWGFTIETSDWRLRGVGSKAILEFAPQETTEPMTEGEEPEVVEVTKEGKILKANKNKGMSTIENQIAQQVVQEMESNPKVKESMLVALEKLGVVPNQVELVVKTNAKNKGKKITGQHKMFEIVLKAIVAKANIALVGPAGSGKTTLVHKCADVLNLPFYSKSVSAQTSIYEFFGYMDANGNYIPTLFREAYEKGGVYLVDEFDAGNPNVLASLNQATANGSCAFPDKMVSKHKDFIVVMAWNTYWTGATMEYVGRNKIDAATLDRFAFILLPYDEVMEMKIADDKEWCKYVQAVRKKANDKKVKCIISPRASIIWSHLLAQWISKEDVKKMTIFKGLSEEEIKLINIT